MSIANYSTICGLDEVGRGSLAGPLVACGVIVNNLEEIVSSSPCQIRDSKIMTHRQRVAVSDFLLPRVIFQMEEVSVEEINQNGIGWANKEIFVRLRNKLHAEEYIVDGNLKFDDLSIKSLIDADATTPQVSMASIIAKVFRDNLMDQLHPGFPHFNWQKNKGYGTLEHRNAIKFFGPSSHHRIAFI